MINIFGHIYEETECNCEKCISMCSDNKPCWGLPEEIERIIELGYSDKLMLVYYLNKNLKPVQILAPALIGYEKKIAPVIQRGRCTFLDSQNECILHKYELKPLEGRVASCKSVNCIQLREDLASLWDTEKGKDLVKKWKKK